MQLHNAFIFAYNIHAQVHQEQEQSKMVRFALFTTLQHRYVQEQKIHRRKSHELNMNIKSLCWGLCVVDSMCVAW